jgi:hypothetical protein
VFELSQFMSQALTSIRVVFFGRLRRRKRGLSVSEIDGVALGAGPSFINTRSTAAVVEDLNRELAQ